MSFIYRTYCHILPTLHNKMNLPTRDRLTGHKSIITRVVSSIIPFDCAVLHGLRVVLGKTKVWSKQRRCRCSRLTHFGTTNWPCGQPMGQRSETEIVKRFNNYRCHRTLTQTTSWVIVHYSDVIMAMMAYQITGVSIVYSTVCSGPYKRYQSSASLAFVRGIHR